MSRLLPLLALCACGQHDGTWILALDRAAGSGCNDALGGQVQIEMQLFRDGDVASAWIAEGGAVLDGTWSKTTLELTEDPSQSTAAALELSAEIKGDELSGTWREIALECTQTTPVTGWRLSDDAIR